MNTDEPNDYYGKLTHQQQRFCDLYLTHFNAFKAAIECGYSENTSRKGALLHVPKIQQYLKAAMNRRSQRLEITHDMILRELSKIAFSNMGNYYDEYGCLKRMNELTVDEKGAIAYYDIVEIQDGEGYRVGTQSRIKLHNKMSALDKIARHLGFYGVAGGQIQKSKFKSQNEKGYQVASIKYQDEGHEEEEDGLLVRTPTKAADGDKREVAAAVAVVDRGCNNLPMDYPVEDFELEGVELKTLMALEGVNVSPGRALMIEGLNDGMIELEESGSCSGSGQEVLACGENMENILTISPLGPMTDGLNDRMIEWKNKAERRQAALGIGADTGHVAKACAV